ncbi:cysteine hydrolase family protein [Streptomyces tsukubensis]|uniref:Cysteine hydrolase n=1 Tax=Streptomyces tsukubensis TaxID=83656 RepID=A0A1V3ZZK7_9ACTN|nr:cysteine hydrolase family protein [Streptomyces tsukubensis]OON71944.1 cysteine hydrolase [Streptomyces tsukubensis]QFR96893.1 isochorismatase family protein [Streptomyces tsukubensis]
MKRALVVIDVQNEYVTGGLPIAYPAPAISLANIAAAVDTATQESVPVVVVQHVAPAGAPLFARGTHGSALHDVVASRRHDHLVEKSFPSAFIGTDLDEWLRRAGVDTLTIAGYMTQTCDESTARHASQLGYRVELLSDATGALALSNRAGSLSAAEIHHAVLVVVQAFFAYTATTAEWVDAIRGKSPLGTPDFAAAMDPGQA